MVPEWPEAKGEPVGSATPACSSYSNVNFWRGITSQPCVPPPLFSSSTGAWAQNLWYTRPESCLFAELLLQYSSQTRGKDVKPWECSGKSIRQQCPSCTIRFRSCHPGVQQCTYILWGFSICMVSDHITLLANTWNTVCSKVTTDQDSRTSFTKP